MRLGVADDPDPAAALLAEPQQARAGLGRDVVERLGARVEQALALHQRVPPPDVDEARALAIGGSGDRAHDLLGPEVGQDLDLLALLDVRADLDDQLGEALRVAQICHAPPRRTGTVAPSRVIPSTSTSGLPIMKSTWRSLRFARARSASSSSGKV